ncbi:MAG: cyclic nucleotide-binding domain-containing protein [Gammaproteobacteria bacterium]
MNLSSLFNNETDVTACADGEVIFREGERGDAMYVVVEGSVTLSVRGIEIGHLEPGELFGEMALIDAEPRSATATARGACRIARVDERRFTFLVQQTPFFALHVMRVLAARLRHMDDTLH